ncbi:ABC transporter permease [Streptomyces prasinopilosus]|uniref:Transport permease protein n=1 Tax=Streptomyces prasinopilosus TaxID=67344 RepID=A0A1G6Y281_9ACTN|nr:ABC transporter permease [Streptomyces prasinopilosus]SDD84043.1 ABC-2 type transport system permease protein [Streptomyces prasinopilosus]
MSAATASPVSSSTTPRPGRAVLRAELLLFFREPGSVFWVMAFPTLLLLTLGLIPSMTEPSDELGGLSTVEAYVPVAVLLSMIMAGLVAMPPVITGYRERGILRRMSTTPVRPTAVLGAQVGLHAAASLISAVLTLAVGRIFSGVALPSQVLGYLLTLLLAVVCVLALGALISALSPTTKIAQAVSISVFFPAMLAAGVYMPIQQMPDLMADIVEALPFGAGAQALNQATAGDWPDWIHLGVLALWTLVLSTASARWFRWE